jgi:hypothetical protein
MQLCEAMANANIFVAHVPGERAPLPAHQCDDAFIAQGGIGERDNSFAAWLERLVLRLGAWQL